MTTIVTAVYNNLYGTTYGGRPSRETHYLSSLKTLMRMTDARYIIYTNDTEKVETFLKDNIENSVNYVIIPQDLSSTPDKEKIDKLKNIDEMKQSFRCFELQYMKIHWLLHNLPNHSNEYIYWLDAGLSYSGLIPDKYLNIDGPTYYDRYFNSSLFNNKFLHNLRQFSQDKFFVVAKDNTEFFWSHTIPESYYTQYCNHRHIIGGLFGGQKNIVEKICSNFLQLLSQLLDQEKELYSEEQILTALYYRDMGSFNPHFFDLWWHESNIANLFNGREQDILSKYKSFYKVLEALNS
jgi:hypothetical protein